VQIWIGYQFIDSDRFGLSPLNLVFSNMDSAFLAIEPNQKQVLVETNGETYLVHLPDNDFLTNQSDQEVLI
jgi:hypothetical protein